MCVYIFVCVYICISMSVCVYIYIYIYRYNSNFSHTCLPTTLNLKSSTIPARSVASHLPSPLFIHRWAIKDRMGAEKRMILSIYSKQRKCLQCKVAVYWHSTTYSLPAWAKERELWSGMESGGQDNAEDHKEVAQGRKPAKQQDGISCDGKWEAEREDECWSSGAISFHKLRALSYHLF